MNINEILDIIEYQFGKEVRKIVEKYDLEIKKYKSRKIEVYFNKELFLTLNPKFFLFSIGRKFAKEIKKCKKFYIKVRNEFLEDIRRTKNIFRKNIIEFSNDFRFGDDVIVIDENENLIAIAKAKINSIEINNSTYGIIARIKKWKE